MSEEPPILDASQETYINPDQGYELLRELIRPEDLADFATEVNELDSSIVDPWKKRWLTPQVDESNPELRSEYYYVQAVDIVHEPDFSERFPALSNLIASLIESSGLNVVDTLNVARYRQQSQIPPHHDPEMPTPHRIYAITISGSGLFRVWPDETTIGYIEGDPSKTTDIPVQAGDGVLLTSIAQTSIEEEPYVAFSTDPKADAETYLTRYHSAENASDQERVVLVVGLS